MKTLTEQNGILLISEFQYDQRGRLSGIKTQTSDSARSPRWEQSTYTYDNQNRLGQVQRVIQVQFPPSPPTMYTDSYTYRYMVTGQIEEIRYTNNAAADLLFVCKPHYDPANQIVGNQVDSYNGYQSVQFASQFNYANNNLTAAHVTFSPSGQAFDYAFTYDSKVNPFYGIIMPFSSLNIGHVSIDPRAVFVYPAKNDGIANLMSLSRNNVLSDGYNNYVYTYNSVGLPISRTAFRAIHDPFITGVFYFEYESY